MFISISCRFRSASTLLLLSSFILSISQSLAVPVSTVRYLEKRAPEEPAFDVRKAIRVIRELQTQRVFDANGAVIANGYAPEFINDGFRGSGWEGGGAFLKAERYASRNSKSYTWLKVMQNEYFQKEMGLESVVSAGKGDRYMARLPRGVKLGVQAATILSSKEGRVYQFEFKGENYHYDKTLRPMIQELLYRGGLSKVNYAAQGANDGPEDLSGTETKDGASWKPKSWEQKEQDREEAEVASAAMKLHLHRGYYYPIEKWSPEYNHRDYRQAHRMILYDTDGKFYLDMGDGWSFREVDPPTQFGGLPPGRRSGEELPAGWQDKIPDPLPIPVGKKSNAKDRYRPTRRNWFTRLVERVRSSLAVFPTKLPPVAGASPKETSEQLISTGPRVEGAPAPPKGPHLQITKGPSSKPPPVPKPRPLGGKGPAPKQPAPPRPVNVG